MESEDRNFFEKVRNGYLELAKNYPDRIKLINSECSIDEIFVQVRSAVDDKLI